MNERDFIYWLQGFLEISNTNKLTENQVKMIKEHIALVLHKITPIQQKEIQNWKWA